MFSQSGCEVSASLTDVGGVAVRAIHLIYCFLSDDDFSDLRTKKPNYKKILTEFVDSKLNS